MCITSRFQSFLYSLPNSQHPILVTCPNLGQSYSFYLFALRSAVCLREAIGFPSHVGCKRSTRQSLLWHPFVFRCVSPCRLAPHTIKRVLNLDGFLVYLTRTGRYFGPQPHIETPSHYKLQLYCYLSHTQMFLNAFSVAYHRRPLYRGLQRSSYVTT